MNLTFSVRTRLIALCALLLLALAGTNLYLRSFVQRNLDMEAQHKEQMQHLQKIQAVEGAVASIRFWTWYDASAELLGESEWTVESERQLNDARSRLQESLTWLEAEDAQTAGQIRAALSPLPSKVGQLVEEIRAQREAEVRRDIEALREGLMRAEQVLQAAREREQVRVASLQAAQMLRLRESQQQANFIAFGGIALGLLLTCLVVRSIVRPLNKTVNAMRQVNDGSHQLDLPPVTEDEFGEMALALRQFRDHAEKLDRVAYTDVLTGLANRLKLEEVLRHELCQCEQQRLVLALLFLDLDNFKSVNDTLGHAFGDRYLSEAALRLRRLAPKGAQLFRYSGDEFVVLLSGLPGNVEPRARVDGVAQRILEGMVEVYLVENHRLSMSVSIGAAIFPRDGEHIEDLISAADAAMYQAKRAGRNNVQFSSRELTDGLRKQLVLTGEIRRGLEADEFEPYFQPVINTATGEVAGVEALMRWLHPSRGLVMPAEFIAIAEESDAINSLGDRVLKRGCEEMIRMRNSTGEMRLAVNLSARQLRNPNLVEGVRAVLHSSGLLPEHLEFEITESTVMENMEQNIRILQALRDLGVSLAIDDFGTGYSSLSYVQRFPVSKIKIDRSFVKTLGESRESEAIISATLAMAQALRLDVVAEGVETAEQSHRLRALGCIYQQGYLFTPALPPRDFEAWVERTAARRLQYEFPQKPIAESFSLASGDGLMQDF